MSESKIPFWQEVETWESLEDRRKEEGLAKRRRRRDTGGKVEKKA